MNRAGQLAEALSSCLACKLHCETEFIIIDNASTDDTEHAVHTTLRECGYSYYYEKLPENLGVGGGRNYAYGRASGEYVYMLDDDAIIDPANSQTFFINAIDILDKNPQIATLTTQIYDTAWEKNRVETRGPDISDGLHKCLMFCGGSHFLRTAFFKREPYLPNKYGYEELPPSLLVLDAEHINAFSPTLCIVHKPAINKWDWNDEKNLALLLKQVAYPYAIKKRMYPLVFRPVLWFAFKFRAFLYLRNLRGARKMCKQETKNMYSEYRIEDKIKVSTVLRMIKDFGLSAF